MDGEITLVVPIHAKKEFHGEVRKRLVDLAQKTQKEKGNICYVLHEIHAEPDHFLIYEKWKNQAALDFHMEQDYLKAFLADEKRILSKPIAGTVCKEI
ncbi:MAG: putative quinol monooxygenase [Lentisphaerae bacterium]|nr:putative quinol monooxygenase [Lentisphaerota bacterium]